MDTFKNEIFSRIKDEESKSTIERNLIKLSRDLKVSYESIEEDFISFRKGLNKPYKKETQNKKVDQRFEVTPAYKKAEKIVIDYSIKDKSYFDVIERSMGSRLFLRDQNFRKLFIFIGDIYDKYSRTLPIDEMIIKLKELNVYGDYEFDKKYNFSIDDLEKNILNSFRKRDLKEEIDLLNDKIRSNTLEKDELNKLILELQEKRKELKKL